MNELIECKFIKKLKLIRHRSGRPFRGFQKPQLKPVVIALSNIELRQYRKQRSEEKGRRW